MADVLCEVVETWDDMMPGTYVHIECTKPATVLAEIDGPWGSCEMLLCPEHADQAASDIHDTIQGTRALTPPWKAGWHQGQSEAMLVPLSPNQVACLVHDPEGVHEDLAPRTPLTGEWVNEAVDWDDSAVADYQHGFAYGWTACLHERAGTAYGADAPEGEGDVW